jgi:hypothetical protein
MLNSKRVLFNAYQRVQCLSKGRLPTFNAYQCGKKVKSINLETTFFRRRSVRTELFLPAKSDSVPFWLNSLISKYTGTSRLSPSHLVVLTISFPTIPPWPLRSSSSPRTINFPLEDDITPTAPFFARPLPKIHTSFDTASTPPKQYQYLIWVSNHPPVPSCGDPTAGLFHSSAFI